MRNFIKILLLIIPFILGNQNFCYAETTTLPVIDNKIIESKCIGCFEFNGVDILDLETITMNYTFCSISDRHHGRCEDKDSRYKIQYSINKMPYVFTDEFKIKNYGEKLVCPCGYNGGSSKSPLTTVMIIESGDWHKISLENKEYYVHKEIMKEEEDERKFFCLINGKLNLVTLNTEEINLYKNKKCEVTCENVIQAYQILESTDLAYYDAENNVLICKGCRECDTCSKEVASNGMTQDAMQLSNFCPEHACGFIWDILVSNVSFGNLSCYTIENLICKVEKIEGFSYCQTHKCGECPGPVVGVNVNPIIKNETPEFYSGSNEFGYSNYCQNSFCYEVGCRAIRSGKAAGKEWCANHINKCSYPNCNQEVSKRITKKLCDQHASKEANICKFCGTRCIDNACLNCNLDTLLGDVFINGNEERKKNCEHPENELIVKNEYILLGFEDYHGKKAICNKCGFLTTKLEVHIDEESDGICDSCSQICRILKDPIRIFDGNMGYLMIDGRGDETHMFCGGNHEMREFYTTINKMGGAIHNVDGKVIVVRTREESITDRKGNNWKYGVNASVEQAKEMGTTHFHGYSSGSQHIISTVSTLIQEGSNQVEQVTIYDGYFAADTVPEDFEIVLKSGVPVTFYSIQTTADESYYKDASDRIEEWKKLYPNLEVINLEGATHNDVVQKSQEYNGEQYQQLEKCQKCDKESTTQIVKGYCGVCWQKMTL